MTCVEQLSLSLFAAFMRRLLGSCDKLYFVFFSCGKIFTYIWDIVKVELMGLVKGLEGKLSESG